MPRASPDGRGSADGKRGGAIESDVRVPNQLDFSASLYIGEKSFRGGTLKRFLIILFFIACTAIPVYAVPPDQAEELSGEMVTKVYQMMNHWKIYGDVIDVNQYIGIVIHMRNDNPFNGVFFAGQIGHVFYHEAKAVGPDFVVAIRYPDNSYFEVNVMKLDKMIHPLVLASENKNMPKVREIVNSFLSKNLHKK